VGQILSSRLGIYTPPNKCAICNREEFSNGLCTYHYKANEQIDEVYEEWKEREGVSFNEYLERIKKFKSTGKWVVEVIEHFYGGR
jgi:Topoisomerase IA